MRRSLSFPCEGETLFATIDESAGPVGLLIVTGGQQTRIGPHRMMAKLARDLAEAGHPVFRFDRRGVGDSSGNDPGYIGSAQDIAAAVDAFKAEQPLGKLWGLGLCDGATSLALHHAQTAFDGLILLNPWVVEAEAGSPPPAAARAHYREQLLTLSGWKKLFTRLFKPSMLTDDLRAIFSTSDQSLASDVITSLAGFEGQIILALAERDATARAFLDSYHGPAGALLKGSQNVTLVTRDSASHSFASAEDYVWLRDTILNALGKR